MVVATDEDLGQSSGVNPGGGWSGGRLLHQQQCGCGQKLRQTSTGTRLPAARQLAKLGRDRRYPSLVINCES